MKNTKLIRTLSLLMSILLLALPLAGCNQSKEPSEPTLNHEIQTDPSSSATNPSETAKATEPTTEPPTEPTAIGWLEENLKSIHQNLLTGAYNQVVELLLGSGGDLVNNPLFNALLYIAYAGDGNDTEAAALLDNAELDTDAFTEAFLESVDALKDNPDMAAIKRKLMAHMLALAESNPEAFDAVVKIGDIIQNDDPSDPTAYAARYIAALARGDEAAMEAILAEAKENGISAEALTTTTAAYIEQYNLTSISVEDAENGILTSTTYNEQGDVVKSEETVDQKDNTVTMYVKNSDGALVAEARFYKKGMKPITRTFYLFDRVTDSQNGTITETNTGAKLVLMYENGKIESMTAYLSNGAKNYTVLFDSHGNVTKAYDYSTGVETALTGSRLTILDFTIRNGEMVSQTIPVLSSSGSVIGIQTIAYSYHNPVGLPSGWVNYDKSGNKVGEATVEYTFASNAKAEYKTVEYAAFISGGMKETTTLYYSSNVVVSCKVAESLLTGGEYTDYYESTADYVNHTFTEIDYFGYIYETARIIKNVMDDTNSKMLSGEVYTLDGVLTEKRYATWNGDTLYSELAVHYDAQGRITKEVTYGVDREVSLYDPKTEVFYTYASDSSNAIAKKEVWEYSTSGQIAYYKSNSFTYDEYGRCYFKSVTEYDLINGTTAGSSVQDYYDGDRIIGTVYKTYVPETNQMVQTAQDQYYYNEDGTLSKISVYSVNNGSGTKVKDTEYTYSDGVMTGYSVTTMDSSGNPVKTVYYTADGAAYRAGILENGEWKMYKIENGEYIPEETVPEETVPEETVPDETVPDETVPDETVPDETVPDETVPDETVPDETVPDETVPDETVPDETVPDETVPDETTAA